MLIFRGILFVFLLCDITNGYYIFNQIDSKKTRLKSSQAESIVQISSIDDANSVLPIEFMCNFTYDSEQYSLKFVKSESNTDKPQWQYTDRVYTLAKSLKVLLPLDVKYEKYISSSGDAFATVIGNDDLNGTIDAGKRDRFRVMVSATIKDFHLDILPVLEQILTGNSVEYRLKYSVEQRRETINYGIDYLKPANLNYITVRDRVASTKHSNKRKRSAGPVQAYVELLVVTDYSTFVHHKNITNITDTNLCLTYMKVYYSHFFTGVNQRYTNSLVNDSSLNINVKATNFLFLTTPEQSYWTDQRLVWDNIYGYTYQGQEAILASSTLAWFNFFINNQTLPFDYDHAMAIIRKDFWNSNTGDSVSSRSGIVGLAYVGSICTRSALSIVEENGFNSISVAAHELGHSLGSGHDGSSGAASCNASSNYVMTPTLGYSTNLQNVFYFSNCSLNQFKGLLISSGTLSSSASCLQNMPTNLASQTAFFNNSLNGQLWNADDQCKLIMGAQSSASDCEFISPNICLKMYCSSTDGYCYGTNGWGALPGTECGTNQRCNYIGQCVFNLTLNASDFQTNPCDPNPCLNGGTCNQVNRFFICMCTSSHSGLYCQNGPETSTNYTINLIDVGSMAYSTLKFHSKQSYCFILAFILKILFFY